jgi:two-component system NarL family response regulator
MKILVIDDRKEDRESLAELLRAYDYDLEDVSTGAEGIEYLKRRKADVVLLDIVMQERDGIEILKDIRAFNPEQDVILITAYATLNRAIEGLREGAYDFLKKPFTNDELFTSLGRVRQRRQFQKAANETSIADFSREIIKSLFSLRIGGVPVGSKIARKALIELLDEDIRWKHQLTHREKKIMEEIENGLSYKNIAAKLYISPHTVHSHIKNIFEKLQAKNRQEALLKVRRKGLI